MVGTIQWVEPGVYTGKDAVVLKAGMGVGGGTLTWLGVMPRFHPEDFKTKSTEGVGEDWPIGYEDLRPYYSREEREFGVAGERGPVAPGHFELPMPAHRVNWHVQGLGRGARAMGGHAFARPGGSDSIVSVGR